MTIPVYYTPSMVADSQSYSPSAEKPAAVIASWREARFPLEVVAPRPLDAGELASAHDRRMVDAILEGRRDNGFGNRSPEVAATLPYTSGAMYAAAVRALADRRVAVAPVSGFHHAGFDSPGGYCTFNGLVITARLLKRRQNVSRVGILDFDQHFGDGTEAIIRLMHLDWIVHHTAGRFDYGPDDAETFLAGIPRTLDDLRDAGCAVVLYQAGADPHIDDPLGGFLTSEQLRRRDEAVFRGCRARALPVAWNLAGGYRKAPDGGLRPVLDVHDHTMRECVAVYENVN
jgi:acetoin utilization deacetylase AcuC-like enzyme